MRRLTFSMLLTALPACNNAPGSDTQTTGTQATTGTDASTDTVAGTGTGGTTGTPTTGEPDGPTSEPMTTLPADPTTGGSSTTGTTGDVTTGDVTTTSTGDATTGDTTTGEDTTGGSSPLVIAVVDAELWADCMPEVKPDPVKGSWYVEYDNTANPAATMVVLTQASLTLEGSDVPELIAVSPTESGPIAAGDYVSQEVAKLEGAMHSACNHCGEFYLLELEYDEAGVSHHVEELVTISCAL